MTKQPPLSHPQQLDPDLRLLRESLVDYHTERLLGEQERRAGRFREQGPSDFSLRRTVLAMADGSLGGGDRAVLDRFHGLSGGLGTLDPQRVFLPWALFRDMTVASAASAGYLVATSVGGAADALRGWSVTASAGVTFVDNLAGNFAVPRVTTAPSAYAIATEATAITESTPVLGAVGLTTKNLACFVEFSRQLLLQSNVDTFVRMVMLSALGKFLDAQILNGSGASGELTGILNTAGLQTQSGTTLGHSGTTTMKKLASEAGARDEDLAFVSTPAIRQTLESRETATGSGFVWQADAVAGRPAFASNECPAATMLVGPWPQVVIGQWGPPGITVELNPFEATNFRSGMIQARMVLSVDMGVIRPSAFVKSTSIT